MSVQGSLTLRFADVKVLPKQKKAFSLMLYFKCDTKDLAQFDTPEKMKKAVTASSMTYLGYTAEKEILVEEIMNKGWFGFKAKLTDTSLAGKMFHFIYNESILPLPIRIFYAVLSHSYKLDRVSEKRYSMSTFRFFAFYRPFHSDSACVAVKAAVGLLAAASLFFAPAAFSADILRLEGAPVVSTKAAAVVTWRSVQNISNETAVTFVPLPALTLKSLQEENSPDGRNLQSKRVKIGVNRNADTEARNDTPFTLNWQNNGDGYIARVAVTSPEAKALRVALQLEALPDVAELRFSGSGEPQRILGVISGQEANALRNDEKIYWTPGTEGETQHIEIYLPLTAKMEDVRIRLNAVSHLFTSAQAGFNTTGLVKASASCEVDVACKFSSLGTAFQDTSKAVARMVFSDSTGTYACSGTALNSVNPQTPYFWSAALCISSQAVASTLNTYWFDEANGCGSSQVNPNYQQLSGGAQLLHANTATDTLLLQLNNPVPANAWLAGWDANHFPGGAFIAIHQLIYDFKKVSTGNGAGKTCDTRFNSGLGVNVANLSLVSWTEGIVEKGGGGAGAGLFTLYDGDYYLRGGASVGAAITCSDIGLPPDTSNNASCFSDLSLVYDSVKQYLAGSGSNPPPSFGPTRQYTGQWIKADEGAWGLTVLLNFPSDSRYIFVPWYTYDATGKASWYIFQGNNWSANDSITADVFRYTGPTWGVMPYDNTKINSTKVGTATLTFISATTATFSYAVEGASRTITLVKLQ